MLTAAQIEVVGGWTERGPDFLAVVVYAAPPRYAREWETGDVIATQGDAFVHVGSGGAVKDAVPPTADYPGLGWDPCRRGNWDSCISPPGGEG